MRPKLIHKSPPEAQKRRVGPSNIALASARREHGGAKTLVRLGQGGRSGAALALADDGQLARSDLADDVASGYADLKTVDRMLNNGKLLQRRGVQRRRQHGGLNPEVKVDKSTRILSNLPRDVQVVGILVASGRA